MNHRTFERKLRCESNFVACLVECLFHKPQNFIVFRLIPSQQEWNLFSLLSGEKAQIFESPLLLFSNRLFKYIPFRGCNYFSSNLQCFPHVVNASWFKWASITYVDLDITVVSTFLTENLKLSERIKLGTFRPRLRQGYPLNLSISLSGGKETNKDSPSNGEWRGKSSSLKPVTLWKVTGL